MQLEWFTIKIIPYLHFCGYIIIPIVIGTGMDIISDWNIFERSSNTSNDYIYLVLTRGTPLSRGNIYIFPVGNDVTGDVQM